MSENHLEELDARRIAVNRRIGIYSLWLILIGSGLALYFIGGGMAMSRRWGIFALIVAYVGIRVAIMSYRKRKNDKKAAAEAESSYKE